MNKQKLIEEIKKEKYDFSKPETSLDSEDYKEGYNDASDDILDTIKQLDEPQRVKVKPYVAEWFEKNKDDLEFNIWRYIRNWNEHPKDEFQMFMNNGPSKPIETLIRMQDGYEVEEEQKYYLDLPKMGMVNEISNSQLCWTNCDGGITEKEIKTIDERYWPFAVPVEKV